MAVHELYALQMVYIRITYIRMHNYWLHQHSHHTALVFHQCTQTLPCVYRNGQSLSKVESLQEFVDTSTQCDNAAEWSETVTALQ